MAVQDMYLSSTQSLSQHSTAGLPFLGPPSLSDRPLYKTALSRRPAPCPPQDYSAQYTLALLALPLGDDHAVRRARGLKMLASIVRQPGAHLDVQASTDMTKPGQQQALEELLRQARAVLTAQEQVGTHMQ